MVAVLVDMALVKVEVMTATLLIQPFLVEAVEVALLFEVYLT